MLRVSGWECTKRAGPFRKQGMFPMPSNIPTVSVFTEVCFIEQKSLVILREKQNVSWPKKLWTIQCLGLGIQAYPSLTKVSKKPQCVKITCLRTTAMYPFPETLGRGCYDRVPNTVSVGARKQASTRKEATAPYMEASSPPPARGALLAG